MRGCETDTAHAAPSAEVAAAIAANSAHCHATRMLRMQQWEGWCSAVMKGCGLCCSL